MVLHSKYLTFFLLITFSIVVCLSAFRVDIMDVDAAQYANISREMAVSNQFLQVHEQGHDYLDKPPFLFWISALSMKILGATNFAYKLPSCLFFVCALFSFFLLVKKLYNKDIAFLAALILASSQAAFLITNDVRTDLLLMSLTIISIAHIYIYSQDKRWIHFVIGFCALAFGLMTKGPICAYAVFVALAAHFTIKSEWRQLLYPRYLLGILLVLILLIPMCYGLYTQFDLHPEKFVYGIQGPSGIKFFFWTQSFGRITGSSSWANHKGFLYLFTNIIWAFFPWSLVFIPAFLQRTYQLFSKQADTEYISFGGFVLIYSALAISRYQLPHYIYITFPLVALMCAKYLYDSRSAFPPILMVLSIALSFMVQLIIILVLFTENQTIWLCFVMMEFIILALFFRYFSKQEFTFKYRWILCTAFVSISANVVLTQHFYKNLLQYQASSNLGRYIANHHIDEKEINSYQIYDGLNAIHFYSKQAIRTDEQVIPSKKYVITTEDGFKDLSNHQLNYIVIHKFKQYRITKLDWKFLREKTRASSIQVIYLLQRN